MGAVTQRARVDVDEPPAAGAGQVRVGHQVGTSEGRDEVQHVVVHILGVRAGDHGDPAIDRMQSYGAVEQHADAEFVEALREAGVEGIDAEQMGPVDGQGDVERLEDASTPPVGGGQEEWFECGPGAADRRTRDGEHRSPTPWHRGDEIPGLFGPVEIIAGHRRVGDREFDPRHRVVIRYESDGQDEVPVADVGARDAADRPLSRVDDDGGVAQPRHPVRRHRSLRALGVLQRRLTSADVGEQWAVRVDGLRFDHRDIGDAQAQQSRRRAEAGVSAADDDDVEVSGLAR